MRGGESDSSDRRRRGEKGGGRGGGSHPGNEIGGITHTYSRLLGEREIG